MKTTRVRGLIVEALEYSSVIALRDKNLTEAFLAGTHPVPMDMLDMDSLAQMELCIAIEVNAGVSIVPDELRRIESLEALVALIQTRQ